MCESKSDGVAEANRNRTIIITCEACGFEGASSNFNQYKNGRGRDQLCKPWRRKATEASRLEAQARLEKMDSRATGFHKKSFQNMRELFNGKSRHMAVDSTSGLNRAECVAGYWLQPNVDCFVAPETDIPTDGGSIGDDGTAGDQAAGNDARPVQPEILSTRGEIE